MEGYCNSRDYTYETEYGVMKYDFPIFWFAATCKWAPTDYNAGHHISGSVPVNKNMFKINN